MKQSTFIKMALFVAMFVSTVVSANVFAKTHSPGRKIGEVNAKLGKTGDMIVAKVGDFDISLRNLEASRIAVQTSTNPEQPVHQSYQVALNSLITKYVLRHEAQRRGILVSDQEVRHYMNYLASEAATHPEMQQYLEDQRLALQLSPEQFDAYLAEFWSKALLNQKLRQMIAQEAAPPTDQEVNEELKKQHDKGRNISREEIRTSLAKGKRREHVESETTRLVKDAKIHIYEERLPDEAKPVQVQYAP